MTITAQGLEKLTAEAQEILKGRIFQIIEETFVFTADEDYLNARVSSINKLYRSFFWAAQQSLEKYLKAHLLCHGVSINGKEYSHNLNFLVSELEKYDSFLKNLELSPAKEHEFLLADDLWGSKNCYAFIDSVNKYGNPSNRYDFFGLLSEFSDLFKLDQVVFSLRSRLTNESVFAKVRNAEHIEYYAVDNNYCFAPKEFEHGPAYNHLSSAGTTPSIVIALKGHYGSGHIFEKWLLDNIRITKNEIKRIKGR